MFILSLKDNNKNNIEYWEKFTSQTSNFLTWKRITSVIVIIAVIVQLIGFFIKPSNWLIWNLLTFIVASNLGAVVLAIIAQKTADEIKTMYQTAFDANFYHSLHLVSMFKESISKASDDDKEYDISDKIEIMGPQLYILMKGYLETFENHYYDKDKETESKSVEYDDVEELFN